MEVTLEDPVAEIGARILVAAGFLTACQNFPSDLSASLITRKRIPIATLETGVEERVRADATLVLIAASRYATGEDPFRCALATVLARRRLGWRGRVRVFRVRRIRWIGRLRWLLTTASAALEERRDASVAFLVGDALRFAGAPEAVLGTLAAAGAIGRKRPLAGT